MTHKAPASTPALCSSWVPTLEHRINGQWLRPEGITCRASPVRADALRQKKTGIRYSINRVSSLAPKEATRRQNLSESALDLSGADLLGCGPFSGWSGCGAAARLLPAAGATDSATRLACAHAELRRKSVTLARLWQRYVLSRAAHPGKQTYAYTGFPSSYTSTSRHRRKPRALVHRAARMHQSARLRCTGAARARMRSSC